MYIQLLCPCEAARDLTSSWDLHAVEETDIGSKLSQRSYACIPRDPVARCLMLMILLMLQ